MEKVVKKIRIIEGSAAGSERRERRKMIIKRFDARADGEGHQESQTVRVSCECGSGCNCEINCSCGPDECQIDCSCSTIEGFDGCLCLCGCEAAEITEEDENGHTLIKIRVPKSVHASGEADALVKAAGVSDAVENLSGHIGKLVRSARNQGSSWTQIGEALGISKQAAWERFSGEE